jgi:hypothetical protein
MHAMGLLRRLRTAERHRPRAVAVPRNAPGDLEQPLDNARGEQQRGSQHQKCSDCRVVIGNPPNPNRRAAESNVTNAANADSGTAKGVTPVPAVTYLAGFMEP